MSTYSSVSTVISAYVFVYVHCKNCPHLVQINICSIYIGAKTYIHMLCLRWNGRWRLTATLLPSRHNEVLFSFVCTSRPRLYTAACLTFLFHATHRIYPHNFSHLWIAFFMIFRFIWVFPVSSFVIVLFILFWFLSFLFVTPATFIFHGWVRPTTELF